MFVRGTGCACKSLVSVVLFFTAIACLLSASAAVAQATLSPASLAFGNVAAGSTSAPQSVTLKNTGSASITIKTIALTGSSDYAFVSPPPSTACAVNQTLAKNATCTIRVTLTPSALGAEAASTIAVTTSYSTTALSATLTGTGVAPATVSPSSLSFGNVAAGSPSAVKTVTFTNVSATTALTINSISLPAGYVIDPSTTCPNPGSLAASSHCAIGVTLTPTSVGPVPAGSLTISTNNADVQPPAVALSGTGVAPATVSPSSLGFGNVAAGSPSAIKTVTFTNVSTTTALTIKLISLPAGYAIDPSTTCPNPGSLAASSHCTIGVTLTPPGLGAVPAGSLTISTNNTVVQPPAVALTGTGINPLTFTPTSIAFGNAALGNTISKTISLKNNQTTSLTITSLSGFSGGFSLDSTDTTCPQSGGTVSGAVGAGVSCVIAVYFDPAATGAQSGKISVNYTNSVISAQTFAVTGTGIPPVVLSPASLSFAAQLAGTTSAPKTITVTNQQLKALNNIAVTITGANPNDFSYQSTCPVSPSSLPAGKSCSVAVSFAPTASGTRDATLSISNDASTSPQTAALTGAATAPVTISPTSLSYTANVGTTSAYNTITITNKNTVNALTISSVAINGDFAQTGVLQTGSYSCGAASSTAPPPYTVSPGGSCEIEVSFTPTVGGMRGGQVQFVDSAATSPQVVNLTGTASNPLTILPTSLSFSAQKVGTTSAAKIITLTNHESQAETFSLSATGDFSAASNCTTGTIAANSSCLVYVTFDPSAINTRTGTLTIKNSAASGSTSSGSWSIFAGLTGSGTSTNPGAAVASVFPGAANAGATIPVKITGNGWTNFSSKSVITFTDTASSSTASDITIQSGSQTFVSANEIDAALVIGNPSNVVYGARSITVKSPLSPSGSETATLASAFVILNPSPTYSITNVLPYSGAQGTQFMNVSLTGSGTHWVQGTTYANFGQGITVNSLQILDATDAVANISISNTTFAGYRSIMMATGGEIAVSSSTAFNITPNSAALLSVSPNTSGQDVTIPVTLTASGTHFLQSATTVSFSGGSGVTVGNVNVTSPTTATASVTMASNATPGLYSVTVATGGETATLANAFTVVSTSPYLSSVAPSSAAQGTQSLNVVITGVNTTFPVGTYTNPSNSTIWANFTPGGEITVNSVTVNSATQVTLNISVNIVADAGGLTGDLILNPGSSQVLFPFGFTITPSSASIVSVSPSSVPQGGQVTLNVTGSNTVWDGDTTIAGFYPTPYPPYVTPKVNEVVINNPTSAQLAISVPSNTLPGSYTFYMKTGGQTVTASITVYGNTPSLTMNPANGLLPLGTNINQFTVNFIGLFTHFNPGTQAVINGEGVTLTNFHVTGKTSASATLTIVAGVNGTPTAAGLRLVTLTTGGEIVKTYFNVATARILTVSPWHGPQSTTIPVSIVGINTHWVQGTTAVLAGAQMQVSNLAVSDAKHLTFDLTTSFSDNGNTLPTPPGWQLIYINTGLEQLIGGFMVDTPMMPLIASACLTGYLPQCVSSAQQGASGMEVLITGNLTSWDSTSSLFLGAGITVTQLTVNSPTSATAVISVSPTAPVGGNGVFMYTADTETTDSGAGFNVTPGAAEISGVVPATDICQTVTNLNAAACGISGGAGTPFVIAQMQTATLNITGVGTHWLQGGTQISFGPGVAIDSLTVNSNTSLTVQITVLSTSPIGFAALTTSTDGEVVTLQQAIDIENNYPTMLASTPFSSPQGNTFTMLVMGRSANWVQGVTTAQFNDQFVTVNSVTVLDSNDLSLNVTVEPWEYVDIEPQINCAHYLTITTGSSQIFSPTNAIGNRPIGMAGTVCVSQGAQSIVSVTPLEGLQGTTPTVTIVGDESNFITGVTQVSFGDPNLQVDNPALVVNSPTSLTVPLGITTLATGGYKTVTITTYGQVASGVYEFTVGNDVGTLNEAIPNQAEQGAPTSTGATHLVVRLIGQYTHFTNQSTATFGAGITVNSATFVSQTPGGTGEVDADITIDPLSYTGSRTVTVTTPDLNCSDLTGDESVNGVTTCTGSSGTGSEIVSANVFSIITGPAIISKVSPNTGNEGQEVVFNITGESTHWQQNYTQFYIAGAGSDLKVNSVVINSPTSATVDLSISSTANPGPRSIYMVTAGESLTDRGAFVVTGGVPVITYLSPNNVAVASNAENSGVTASAVTGMQVTINGLYTTWSTGGVTPTVSFGPGITVASFQVDDDTHISALINLAAGIPYGYRTVAVQTGSQILTSNFLVHTPPPPPTPYIWYESPSSGIPGQTLTITFNGGFTEWNTNTTLSGFVSSDPSTGITINSFQATSATTAIANITIGPNAPASSSTLTLTTTGTKDYGTEVDYGYFGVVIAQPTLSIVDPSSGMQGAQNLNVNVIGQFTAFDSTTTFNFGSGVTVNSVTVLGPTIATVNISIGQLATLGGRSVVATTADATGLQYQVTGAGFSVTPSLAQITAVTPNTAQQGQTINVTVTGSNTHWSGSTVFSFGAGIVVQNIQVTDETDATMTLVVPALASEGPTWATATTLGEVASMNNAFVVTAGTPMLLSSGPYTLPQQSGATFTILSQATQWLTNAPVVSYGDGIVVTSTTVTSNTSLTAYGYVQPTTYTGWRNLTVTAGSQVLTLSNALYVASGPAVVNSVSPSQGGQNQTLTVTITGINTNWVEGVTQLSFPNVLVNSWSVTSPTTITANITVNINAPAGELSVTATTQGEVATGINVFNVIQTQPEVLSVVANSEAQGWTGTVTITGDLTHFNTSSGCSPCSTVSFGTTDIAVNSVNASSSTSLQANITVQPTAAMGYRNVSVTTGSEVAALNNAFQVTAGPAAIQSLNPAGGQQNASYTVTVTGSQTHFNGNSTQGAVTTASFGGGIQVTGITVTSPTVASVNITIPSGTTPGYYYVSLTTGGEVASIGVTGTGTVGFQVTPGNAIISVVSPPTGHQGDQNLSIALTGEYTHFVNGTSTASFGAGITVNSLTVSDATDAVANITISSSATIGSRNVTVTTGGETATRIGGFSVLAGVPALVSVTPSSDGTGHTLNVTIVGQFTAFQSGSSTVSMGAGITVNSITNVTAAQLTANISIDPNATLGARDVSVTTSGSTQTLSSGFTVLAGMPLVSVINPNIGSPGQAETVTITGLYTNWVNGTTTASFGPQISVGGAAEGASGPVTVTNATTLTATLAIDPNAANGPVTVIVTTGAEVENVPAGFTIQPPVVSPPTLVSLSPGEYAGGAPVNSNIIAVFSQPMMRSTINTSNVLLYLYDTPQYWISVPGAVTLDASGLVMTFTPNALLPVDSTFDLQMTGNIEDASGNAFGGYTNYLYNANFSTTFSANTTAPTVVAANPLANSNAVGTNVSIQLEFSTDMDQATQSGLTVSTGGNLVAGTYSWNASINCCSSGPGTILTFTPTAPLAANTNYTVSYGAPLADTAGNALTPGSFSFTTGSGADTANISTGVNFYNWESGLGTNFVPKVTFSEPVNPIDINTGTLYLYNYDSGKYLKGTVILAPNGLSATFAPSLPLLPDTAYSFYMSGGNYGMDGNSVYGNTWYFTTGNGSDLTTPTVASIDPVNIATAVPLNAQIVAHFSEAINPTSTYSITVTPAGGSAIAGTATLASDQVTLTFVPAVTLQPSTVYTAQVSGYANMVGNPGAAFTSSFTTATSVAPLNLSTGLDASGNVITTGGAPDPHWTVTPSGATAPQTAYVVAPGEGGWSPNWSYYGYADGPSASVITVNPNAAQGYPESTYSTTFNLSSYNLNNLCLVGAVQGDPYGTLLLNGTAITNTNQFYPWEGMTAIGIPLPSAMLNQTANTLSYQLASGWDGYEGIRIQAIIETCGASLTGGLSLVSSTPASGLTGVPTNTTVTMTFNNPIDPATVNSSTLAVTITQDTNQTVAGSYQVSGSTVTFTPDTPFPVNTTIWVYAANGPSDMAGEHFSGQWLLSFTTATTAAPVTPAPPPFQVVAFTPGSNATNVGLRAPVVATFNRSVNPYTINQSSATADFALFNGDSQSPWCQSYSKSQDNTTLQFNCPAMPASAIMTAMLNSNLQDFNSNALANYTSQFTTMPTDSPTGGSIASTRPGNGASGIGVNQPLVLYTNLPINPATANAGLQVAQNNAALEGTVQVLDNGYTLEFTPTSPWIQGALIQWWVDSSLTDATYNNSFNTTSGYFYVAVDTRTLAPTVQAMSPSNGAQNIPLNAILDIQFNTPLAPATVNSNNIYLYDYDTGLNIAATYSMPQPNEVRMVPSGTLSANDYIMVYITNGLTSSTSVPATPVGWFGDYFYTGTSDDTTTPVVTNAVPYNRTTNVGVNTTPGVVFNKAIDPVSVNSNTFTVTSGGTPLPGSFWISSDDTRVEFVPNAPLPASTSLTMTLNGVLDRVGNPVAFSSTFTTSAGPDVTAPSILWTSVNSGESIPTNSTITVQFSESMDLTTFTAGQPGSCGNFIIYDVLSGWNCIGATLTWNSGQAVAYLTPTSPLAAGREYYLSIGGGTDLAGNTVNGANFYFYAEFSAATTAPTVLAFNPISGNTVGTNAIVEAQFSAPIDPTTVSGVTLTGNSSTVPTTPVLSVGNTVLQLVPATPLAPGTTFTMTVQGVKDPAGNAVATRSNSFKTGTTFDINPPSVVSTDPPNNATVGTNVIPKIVFNKPLNPIGVNTSYFELVLNDTGQLIPSTVSLSANGLEVTLTPQIALLPNTEYTFSNVNGGGSIDEDGNYSNLPWYYFYTGGGADSTALTVTAVSPVSGASGIPLNAQAAVTVSAAIDPTTVTQSSLQLLDSSNHPVAGTVSEPSAQMLAFTPSSNLTAGMTYTVKVNADSFADANGNQVAAFSSTFQAGTATATGGLSLTGISVSTSQLTPITNNMQPVTLTFSQILDPATVSSSTVGFMNGGNSNMAISGTYSVNGNQVTFTPTTPYPAGAQIYVGFCNGPTDVLGEYFSGCWNYRTSFWVSSGLTDNTAFYVTSVSPANGATNVGLEHPVSVTFSKSINSNSVWNGYQYNAVLYAGQDVQDYSNFSYSSDNRTLYFNVGALHNGATYTISLPMNGITDQSGNYLTADSKGDPLTAPFASTFTAMSDPAAGGGSVQQPNPGYNATSVPTDTLLTLYMNRQVESSTVAGNVTVTVNGQIYGGALTLAADGYEIQYTPTTAFPNGATVQWFLSSNVMDVYGNNFNSASGVFYTAAAVNASTASPQILAISPGCCGLTGLPTNTQIDIEYSQPIDATTLSGNVWLNSGPSTPTFSVGLASPNVVRITPNSPWNASTFYGFCTDASVKGTNGVAAQGDCWATYFTVGTATDTTSGTVTIGPPNGVINVGTNAYIRMQFSKPADRTTVNSNTVTVTVAGNPIPVTFTYNYNGPDLIGANFYPVNPLPPSSTISIVTNGILDYAGNTFTPASSTFTTAALPDYTNPSVSMDFPWYQTGIATNALFTCRYSEAMDPSSVNSSNTYISLYADNSAIPASYKWSSDLMSVTMTPATQLLANSQYYYQCGGAIDLTGNSQNGNWVVFNTGSGTSSVGPQLVYANPPNGMANVPINTSESPWYGSSLGLLFNEPVAGDSLGSITLTPAGGSPIPISAYTEYGNTIVVLQLPYALQPNTTYTYNVTGVTDYNGNPMTPTTSTSTFTTGTSYDFTQPTVASTFPANGAGNSGSSIPAPADNVTPSVTFSAPMDPVLINNSNVWLQTDITQTIVPVTLSFSPDYKTVYLTPSAPLAAQTIYDLVIYGNNWWPYDIAGNLFNSGPNTVSWNNGNVYSTFTTQ